MKLKNIINELSAEAGVGREGKPVIRYYLGGNPKALKFEDLPPESQKNAKMLSDKHRGLFKKLGGGKFDTENGYDINFMGDGRVKITSPSTGISDTVRVN
jgi:hypothetical protein